MSSYSHSDPVSNAIRKYENHKGVKKISETITITSTFHFSGNDKAGVEKSFGKSKFSKVGTFKNIPAVCLKVTSDIWSLFLVATWNEEHISKVTNYRQIKCYCFTYIIKDLRMINAKTNK